jgi:DNA-binding PadR family transcriptional regulator
MDPLKVLEKQSGFLRLLVYLSDKKEKTLTEILDETDIPVHQLYSSIEKAKELGLVETRVDKGKYPARNLIEITQKGSHVAKKVKEIVAILG